MTKTTSWSRPTQLLFLMVLFGVMAAKCDKPNITVDTGVQLNARIDSLNKRIKDVTDLGVLGGGWMQRMLRDYATGTAEERAAAQEASRRLFGTQASPLESGAALMVTVRLVGFTLDASQSLSYDLKYLDPLARGQRPTRANVDSLFNLPAGNGWAAHPVRSADEYGRVIEKAEVKIRAIVEEMIAPVACNRNAVTGEDCIARGVILPTPELGIGRFKLESRAQAEARRQRQVERLVDLVSTPYRVSRLPPAGEWTGDVQIQWGGTQGTGRYLVLAVPAAQVRQHSGFKAFAWLHPKDKPTEYLGVTQPIPATDFYLRCVTTPQEPGFAAVPSRSTDGDLCWYIFDLFPSGNP